MDFDLYRVYILVNALGPLEERERKNAHIQHLLNPIFHANYYSSKMVPEPDEIRVSVNYAIRDISTNNNILIYITKHKVLEETIMEDVDKRTFKSFIRKTYVITREKENAKTTYSKTKEFELVEIDARDVHRIDFMTHLKTCIVLQTQE